MMTRPERLDLLSWLIALGLVVAVAQPSSATVIIDTITDAALLGGVVNDDIQVVSGGEIIFSSGDSVTVNSVRVESGGKLTFNAGDATLTTLTSASNIIDSGGAIVAGSHGEMARLVGGSWAFTDSAGGGSGGKVIGNLHLEASELTLCASCSISADAAGHTAGNGPGASGHYPSSYIAGSGAAHGGTGTAGYTGAVTASHYGSALYPDSAGSGGGSGLNGAGGTGGGTVRITLSGDALIDGTISANGGKGGGSSGSTYVGGGGSGGSIWIDASQVSGAGVFSATGGHTGASGYAGGGGGGRIAVHHVLDGAPLSLSVMGGNGFYGNGEVGTGALIGQQDSQGLRALNIHGGWRFETSDEGTAWSLINVADDASVRGPFVDSRIIDAQHLTMGSNSTWTPKCEFSVTFVDVLLHVGASIEAQSYGLALMADTLTTSENTLIEAALSATGTTKQLMVEATTMSIAGRIRGDRIHLKGDSLNLLDGATVDADGLGYGAGSGTGAGSHYPSSYIAGGGATHGGSGSPGYTGAALNTTPYGAAHAPVEAGSGGGSGLNGAGGKGGGVIRVELTGPIDLASTAQITADGLMGAGSAGSTYVGGGGAGGSVWINCSTISGAGTLSADGGASGASGYGGAGGGGRIAVYTQDWSSFSGAATSTVSTGSGFTAATVGTYALFKTATPDVSDNWSDAEMTTFVGWEFQRGDDGAVILSALGDLTIREGAYVRGPSADGANDAPGGADRITVSGTFQCEGYTQWTSGDFDLEASDVQLMSNATIDVTGPSATLIGTLTSTLEPSTLITADDLHLSGGTVHLEGTIEANTIDINAEALSVSTSGVVSVDGGGFTAGSGPGSGSHYPSSYIAGGGGSHGGVGTAGYTGAASGGYNDSAVNPSQAGSGGGSGLNGTGGSGGGVIAITVSGAFLLDGIVSANGMDGGGSSTQTYVGGGGAGGSVHVDTVVLSGAGQFQANGGDSGASGYGGGGGGGRIFVEYAEDLGFGFSTGGSVAGGNGFIGTGGVGTLGYLSSAGKVVEDDYDLTVFQGWRFESVDAPHRYGHLTFKEAAWVRGPVVDFEPIELRGTLSIEEMAYWTPNEVDTVVSAHVLVSSGGEIDTDSVALSLELSDAWAPDGSTESASLSLTNNAMIDAETFTLTGDAEISLLTGATVQGSALSITGISLLVDSASDINTTGRGPTAGNGLSPGCHYPSSYIAGCGGNHGGLGGAGYTASAYGGFYGSAVYPDTAGSAGGSGYNGTGGRGGGTVRISLATSFTHDGVIAVDGAIGGGSSSQTYVGGGGAGGSIWISADTLQGDGSFSANGGNSGASGYAGGGGGGRVAVHARQWSDYHGASLSTVDGGTGFSGEGGLGTLAFVLLGGDDSTSSDDTLHLYQGYRFQDNDAPHQWGAVVVAQNTNVTGPESSALLEVAGDIEVGDYASWVPGTDLDISATNFIISSGATLETYGYDAAFILSGDLDVAGFASIDSGETEVSALGKVTVGGTLRADALQLTTADLTVLSDGSISADAGGYSAGNGPGASGHYPSSYIAGNGGSYGGKGTQGYTAGGTAAPYGSATEPTDAGSGGGSGYNGTGGHGGGVIRLEVAGHCDIAGTVSASGANGGGSSSQTYVGGGGSGGSIWLTTSTLTGASSTLFKASGGNSGASGYGGGGGGGRIAISFDSEAGFIDIASLSTSGGSGFGGTGQDGTIVINGAGGYNQSCDASGCVVKVCGNGMVEGDEECDDNNTADGDCCSSTCTLDAAGSVCDDTVASTKDDICDGAGQCAGTAYNCDSQPLTDCVSSFAPDGVGCVAQHVANGTPCSHFNACTVGDACTDGVCIPGPEDCDDGIACTVESCLPSTGCVHLPDDTLCGDDNPCTDDTCVYGQGCSNTPNTAACDDGDVCTDNDVCSNGSCSGDALVCDVGSSCVDGDCLGDHCIPCTSDADCAGDEVCDYVAGTHGSFCMVKCADDPSVCQADEVCRYGVASGAGQSAERRCEPAAQCGENWECTVGGFSPDMCPVGSDCLLPDTGSNSGICVQCTDDAMCAVDEHCVDNHCDPLPELACNTNDDCPSGEVCIAEICEAGTSGGTCLSDAACGADEGCQLYIDMAGNTMGDCVAVGPPPPACQSTSECLPGTSCVAGSCVGTPLPGACLSDADCSGGELCGLDGVCGGMQPQDVFDLIMQGCGAGDGPLSGALVVISALLLLGLRRRRGRDDAPHSTA